MKHDFKKLIERREKETVINIDNLLAAYFYIILVLLLIKQSANGIVAWRSGKRMLIYLFQTIGQRY